jgi:hypothetical protein
MIGFLSQPIVLLVLVGIAMFAIGHWLFTKDTQIENKRTKALKVATELRSEGLDFVPEMLETYAVGDYSGIIDKATQWLNHLEDDERRAAFLAKFRRRQLELNMQRPAARAEIMEAVEKYKALEAASQQKIIDDLAKQGKIPAPAPATVAAK